MRAWIIGAIASLAVPAIAPAAIVNIDASNGFNYTNGGGSDPAPVAGDSISFVGTPPTINLAAGTYKISNATGLPGANPDLTAWSYNTGTSSWTWGFVVATSTGTVLDYENAGSGSSKEDVADLSAVKDFASTLTLLKSTAVSFTLRDYYVADNAGGVSLNIEPVEGVPSGVPEPTTWAMLAVGIGVTGGAMRRAHRKSEEKFTRKVRALATA